ncbi:hypothetical protein FGF01_03335 [Aeromonas salmonicida subsp. achromogenes]|nr:hypothetical protein FGF01_03335 [Aeromonas salmonicida subsp. achromogenes]TMX16736.1 hypothetical protein FGE99_03475 [Aeromonas salmonicida subsp. achromogenes]TMX17348.1 hypothetical protein FGF02_02975 [Aeromonas salmonicida subsp. achromogenes]TMX20975.1 hypothetical protein FGF00_03075 [Aeromonas salmonicida subsp. achromogenes]
MIRLFLAMFMAFSLSACASLPEDIPCNTEPAHYDSNGMFVPTAYACPEASPRATYALNECSWVNGYLRKDGTYVIGHTRCKYNLVPPGSYSSAAYSWFGSGYSKSPCVTSYCGPVKVKGYYRKNGTYVRPHTRSYPRKRR